MAETGQEAYRRFIAWEDASRDTIDFKKIYVDMAGEVLAGLMLSQVIYWHLPDKHGNTKLRVERDGYLWLAKAHKKWWDEIRLTRHQADRALRALEERRLIVTEVHKFAGNPTKHIRISDDFVDIWDFIIRSSGEPNRQERITSYIDYLTENTKEGEPPPDARSFLSLTANGDEQPAKELGSEDPLTAKEEDGTSLVEEKVSAARNSAAEAGAQGQTTDVECPFHPGVHYTRWAKDGDEWLAHRLPDGTWCRQAPGAHERCYIGVDGQGDHIRRVSAAEVKGMIKVISEPYNYYITPEQAEDYYGTQEAA